MSDRERLEQLAHEMGAMMRALYVLGVMLGATAVSLALAVGTVNYFWYGRIFP